jgi:hypothetical protein
MPNDECSEIGPFDGENVTSTPSPETVPLLCVVQSPPIDLVQMLLAHAARASTGEEESAMAEPSAAISPTLQPEIVDDAPAPVESAPVPVTVRREFRLEMLPSESDL